MDAQFEEKIFKLHTIDGVLSRLPRVKKIHVVAPDYHLGNLQAKNHLCRRQEAFTVIKIFFPSISAISIEQKKFRQQFDRLPTLPPDNV